MEIAATLPSTAMLLILLLAGLASSMPSARLSLVQKSAGKIDNETATAELRDLTNQVEVAIPLKIQSREDLISWVTYAMRIMASKINITLGGYEKERPGVDEKFSNGTGINETMEAATDKRDSGTMMAPDDPVGLEQLPTVKVVGV